MKKLLLILLLCAALASCEKTAPEPSISHRIIAISSSNGIGDQGYVDVTVLGYERLYADLDPSAYMHICTPHSSEEANELIMSNIEKAKDGVPTLIICGGSDYVDIVERVRADKSLSAGNVSILLFEVNPLEPALNNLNYHTFLISAYGACYDAGQYVAGEGFETPLIWIANPIDRQLDIFRDGFSDGYFKVTGRRPEVQYLAEDFRGYTMSEEAYQTMPQLSDKYDFIFPLIGGSNLGVYRYLRENPDGPHVAGMDVDQSRYADNIVGSVIKHTDRAIVDFVNDWIAGKPLPAHSTFDTSSGYIEWYTAK